MRARVGTAVIASFFTMTGCAVTAEIETTTDTSAQNQSMVEATTTTSPSPSSGGSVLDTPNEEHGLSPSSTMAASPTSSSIDPTTTVEVPDDRSTLLDRWVADGYIEEDLARSLRASGVPVLLGPDWLLEGAELGGGVWGYAIQITGAQSSFGINVTPSGGCCGAFGDQTETVDIVVAGQSDPRRAIVNRSSDAAGDSPDPESEIPVIGIYWWEYGHLYNFWLICHDLSWNESLSCSGRAIEHVSLLTQDANDPSD